MSISEADRVLHRRLINANIAVGQIDLQTTQLAQDVDGYAEMGLYDMPPFCFAGGSRNINAGFAARTKEGDAFLVFRGTLSPPDATDTLAICLDWTQDRLYGLRDWSQGGKTAQGFSAALLSVERAMLWAVKETGGEKVWVTGHSKGGAMALLAATLLVPHSFEIAGVVIFGAPMVGDAAFKSAYAAQGLAARTIRYQNQYDGVPMAPGVPTPGMPMDGCYAINDQVPAVDGYMHPDGLRFIHPVGNNGGYDIVTDPIAAETEYALSMAYAVNHHELIGPAHDPRGGYRRCFEAP